MYGDPEVMRKHAGRLREQSGDLRALADQLVSRTESLHWTGRAAEAMRDRVQDRATRLREVAARHETAAVSLEVHLAEVEALKDAIAATERRADLLVTEARTRMARADDEGGVRAADPADRVLVDFEPPAPGHKDWLAVTLPGLRGPA